MCVRVVRRYPYLFNAPNSSHLLIRSAYATHPSQNLHSPPRSKMEMTELIGYEGVGTGLSGWDLGIERARAERRKGLPA